MCIYMSIGMYFRGLYVQMYISNVILFRHFSFYLNIYTVPRDNKKSISETFQTLFAYYLAWFYQVQ